MTHFIERSHLRIRSRALLAIVLALAIGIGLAATPQAAHAAVVTTSVGHASVTTERGVVGKTYYSGPTVGSNSTSHWLTTGDFVEIVFDGHSFDLYGRTQPNNKTANVLIDGVSVGTASYTGSNANNKLLLSISGLTDGRHTLRLEPTGWVNHQKLDVKSGSDAGPDDLTRSIERYSALVAADYAADSWTAFQTELADARAVADSGASAAARTAALLDLETAAKALVQVAGLSGLIAEFSARESADYAAEAWAGLEGALTSAADIVADPGATQAEVVTAKNALQSASGALIPLDGGEFLPIQNNRFWTDTDGNPIYSQGGGVFEFGDTYYWYGVKYKGAVEYVASPTKEYGYDFQSITVYSSRDLVN